MLKSCIPVALRPKAFKISLTALTLSMPRHPYSRAIGRGKTVCPRPRHPNDLSELSLSGGECDKLKWIEGDFYWSVVAWEAAEPYCSRVSTWLATFLKLFECYFRERQGYKGESFTNSRIHCYWFPGARFLLAWHKADAKV